MPSGFVDSTVIEDADVMAGQLGYLHEAAALPTVSLGVIPGQGIGDLGLLVLHHVVLHHGTGDPLLGRGALEQVKEGIPA